MRAFLLSLLLLLSCQTLGQVQEFHLKNGLKILVKEDHRSPVAVSMLWYNVGSADEPGGITGVSHAIEHMMFKGTTKYKQGEFSRIIASLGGQENAFTTNDYTGFYERIAANHLAQCFELEADRMQNLLLDPAEFAKEIKVIQEERRMRTDDNPQGLTFERLFSTAHLTAPYNHPVIGWMSDLKQMSVDDLKSWYQTYYRPNNATLVVVGDVKPQEVYTLAERYFGKIPAKPVPARRSQMEPPALGKKWVEVNAPAQLPLLMMGYMTPSVKTAKIAWEPYALELLTAIMDAGDSARLNKHLIKGSQVASGVDVYYNLYSRYPSEFVFMASPSMDHSMEDLQREIQNQINALKTTLVSKTELDRVKKQIIAQKTFEKDAIFSQAMELGLLETVGIGWRASTSYTKSIEQVTPEQILQVAKKYFTENNLTVAVLNPIKPKEITP